MQLFRNSSGAAVLELDRWNADGESMLKKSEFSTSGTGIGALAPS